LQVTSEYFYLFGGLFDFVSKGFAEILPSLQFCENFENVGENLSFILLCLVQNYICIMASKQVTP